MAGKSPAFRWPGVLLITLRDQGSLPFTRWVRGLCLAAGRPVHAHRRRRAPWSWEITGYHTV